MMNFHLNAVTNLVLRLGPVAQRWELSLARAVFLHRLGEIRDRKPENQSYRASGLTLLTAAISLWNTVYMERAVDALKRKGVKINEQLLSHLSPLGWEHINLTGDYIWKNNRIPASGKFRRLRPAKVEGV